MKTGRSKFLKDGTIVHYADESYGDAIMVYYCYEATSKDYFGNADSIGDVGMLVGWDEVYDLPSNYYRGLYYDGRKSNLKDGRYLVDNVFITHKDGSYEYQLKPVTQEIIDKYIADPSSGMF